MTQENTRNVSGNEVKHRFPGFIHLPMFEFKKGGCDYIAAVLSFI